VKVSIRNQIDMLEKSIGKGRFTMIDMSDDAEVSDERLVSCHGRIIATALQRVDEAYEN